MRVSNHDRTGQAPSEQHRRPWSVLVVALALLGSGLYLLYHYYGEEPTPIKSKAVTEPTTTSQPIVLPPAPKSADQITATSTRIPPVPAQTLQPPLAELSPLGDNDSAIREQLQRLTMDPEWLRWLQGENLIQRLVGFIDALARGVVAHKLLPITPPSAFVATQTEGKVWLGNASYQRFNPLATLASSIDIPLATQLFHWLRPLMEASYGELGYAPENFDKTVIAAIDHCLATPEIATPIALKLSAKTYQFDDPKLEALTAVQKQFLRMGPGNVQAIKQQLRRLRAALLEPTSNTDAAKSADSPAGG